MQPKRGHPGSGGAGQRYPGTFLLALREATAKMNWEVRCWLGDAIECVDAGGETHTVGLENLFRRARREERERWPELIADFLNKLREAEKSAVAAAKLDEVADKVLVRLGRGFSALSDKVKIWSQPLAGTDFGISLVVDQAETMTYVTEPMIAESGRQGGDWLEQALANLRTRTPENCFHVVHEESGLLLCNVGDAYDSSRALLLDSLLPDANSLGFLVAIPSRDELVVLPVCWKALAHIHLPWVLAQKNYQNAPYSISRDIYWVHRGDWRLFQIEARDQQIQVRPPDEFVQLLKAKRAGT